MYWNPNLGRRCPGNERRHPLRDAQRHPEKYENLQVRVCGWNVRWNDLPKKEQDAYIRRAAEIAR